MQIKLDINKKYLLACSYGPDSMVLFDLLLKGGYKFSVAHVNYMLRGSESENETKALEAYCDTHNIKCFTKYVDGKTLSGNFQSSARGVRYSFFKELLVNEKLDAVLTAHHLDDHLETYLMQKASKRKSFYYGIRSETTLDGIKIKRPLLNHTKEKILRYASEQNVPYSVDSSNLIPSYTRNKIRLNALKNMDYADKRALINEINNLNTSALELENELKVLVKNNTISIKEYLALDYKKSEHLMYLMFSNAGISNKFSKAQHENINKVIKSSVNSLMHRLHQNIYLVKYELKIQLININNYQSYSYTINKPTIIKTMHFDAYFDKPGVKPEISKDEYPLKVTTFSPGDTYRIKDYVKQVNRLFIDMKLPRHYRLVWPLIKNKDSKVIYIPRYRQDYEPKPTDLFKIHTY